MLSEIFPVLSILAVSFSETLRVPIHKSNPLWINLVSSHCGVCFHGVVAPVRALLPSRWRTQANCWWNGKVLIRAGVLDRFTRPGWITLGKSQIEGHPHGERLRMSHLSGGHPPSCNRGVVHYGRQPITYCDAFPQAPGGSYLETRFPLSLQACFIWDLQVVGSFSDKLGHPFCVLLGRKVQTGIQKHRTTPQVQKNLCTLILPYLLRPVCTFRYIWKALSVPSGRECRCLASPYSLIRWRIPSAVSVRDQRTSYFHWRIWSVPTEKLLTTILQSSFLQQL